MLTKTDKVYIKSELNKLENKLENKFEKMQDHFDKEIRKNGVLLEEVRDHIKLVAEGHMALVSKTDDHEIRIERLEKRL